MKLVVCRDTCKSEWGSEWEGYACLTNNVGVWHNNGYDELARLWWNATYIFGELLLSMFMH